MTETNQVLLRCPFLDESTIDRESGYKALLTVWKVGEEDKNTQIMGEYLASNLIR